MYIAGKLDEILDESQKFGIDAFLLKLSLKRYLKTSSVPLTKEEKQYLEEARIALTAIYVMILYHHDEAKSQRWQSIDQLLREYPQFEGQTQDELHLLLQYRNIVHATLLLIPAARNKKTIMAIAGRLQGRPKDYVTGGGQKEETRIRVDIYEHEGGVQAQRRPDRHLHTEHNCESSVSSMSTPPNQNDESFFCERGFQTDSIGSDASTIVMMEPLGPIIGFGILDNSSQSDCPYESVNNDVGFNHYLHSMSDDDTNMVGWSTASSVEPCSETVPYADDEFTKVAAATGDESLAFSNRNSLRLHLEAVTVTSMAATPASINNGQRYEQNSFFTWTQDNGLVPSYPCSGQVGMSASVLGRRDRNTYVSSNQDEPLPKSLRLAVDPTMFDDDIPDFTPRFRELLIHSA